MQPVDAIGASSPPRGDNADERGWVDEDREGRSSEDAGHEERRGAIWDGMVRYMVWCGVVWYGLARYDILSGQVVGGCWASRETRCACDVVWYGVLLIWYRIVSYRVVWCG